MFERLVQAQAVNEMAEARGRVNTFVESFNTFVADKPNASPEELQKEWGRISRQIKAIQGTFKTKRAETEFTNFLALNEGVINQRAQTGMEAIKSRQELERSEIQIDSFKTNFDEEGLADHYEQMVEAGTYDRETVFGKGGRLENELAIMKVAKQEFERMTMLDDIHEVVKEMPYTQAIQFLNDMKGLERVERNDLIARRKRQNEIETATTNRKVRWDTLRELTKDPEKVTDEYLENLVKPDSLTWDDAEEFKKIRDTANHPLKRTDAQRGFTTLEEIKDIRISDMKEEKETTEAELRDELLLQFGLKNDFEYWLLGKDRTTEDIEKKVKALTAPVAEKITLGWLERFLWKKGGTQLFGLMGTQEQRLVKKKMETLEKEPVWKTMTEREKENAKTRLEQGETLSDVLKKKKLTPEIARQYLDLADGNRKHAEELAKDAGYEW